LVENALESSPLEVFAMKGDGNDAGTGGVPEIAVRTGAVVEKNTCPKGAP
jgi:hypothetical protein